MRRVAGWAAAQRGSPDANQRRERARDGVGAGCVRAASVRLARAPHHRARRRRPAAAIAPARACRSDNPGERLRVDGKNSHLSDGLFGKD